MSKKLYYVNPNITLDDLYQLLHDTLDKMHEYEWAAHPRAKAQVAQALHDYRLFAKGELDIDLGTKRWFKVMAKLAEEIGDMNESQSAYILAMAEIGHAAAHLGHTNTALSRGDRTRADRRFVELNKAYVEFGLQGTQNYLALISR